MIYLTMRTDNPMAEIGLYDDKSQRASITWEAHRQLAETLHQKIAGILHEHKLQWAAIAGIVAYQGPGSFTGLRIGISVANALAYSNGCQIVGTNGEDWVREGIAKLQGNNGHKQVTPEYGSEANITIPRK